MEPFNCTVPQTIVLFDYIFNRSSLLIALFATEYVNRDGILYAIIIPKDMFTLLIFIAFAWQVVPITYITCQAKTFYCFILDTISKTRTYVLKIPHL